MRKLGWSERIVILDADCGRLWSELYLQQGDVIHHPNHDESWIQWNTVTLWLTSYHQIRCDVALSCRQVIRYTVRVVLYVYFVLEGRTTKCVLLVYSTAVDSTPKSGTGLPSSVWQFICVEENYGIGCIIRTSKTNYNLVSAMNRNS